MSENVDEADQMTDTIDELRMADDSVLEEAIRNYEATIKEHESCISFCRECIELIRLIQDFNRRVNGPVQERLDAIKDAPTLEPEEPKPITIEHCGISVDVDTVGEAVDLVEKIVQEEEAEDEPPSVAEKLPPKERRKEVRAYLVEHGPTLSSTLALVFGVSKMTIYNDLKQGGCGLVEQLIDSRWEAVDGVVDEPAAEEEIEEQPWEEEPNVDDADDDSESAVLVSRIKTMVSDQELLHPPEIPEDAGNDSHPVSELWEMIHEWLLDAGPQATDSIARKFHLRSAVVEIHLGKRRGVSFKQDGIGSPWQAIPSDQESAA